MAIWQFDLALVPREGPMPWRGDDGYDVMPVPQATAQAALAWLQQHMGQPWDMMEGFQVFGDERGDRVDVLTNEDGSAELSARLDVRRPSASFVTALCELASLIDCSFFSPENWCLIAPSAPELNAAFARSRAVRYVKDPISVLRGS